MTEHARRKSIYIAGHRHVNPVPNGCRIGNLVMTGVIPGSDPKDGSLPDGIEAQCANMFGHMRAIIEAAGGRTDDIIKVTVWLKDASRRDALNAEWLKMFPDAASRPARHTMALGADSKALVQCDFTAVIE